MSEAFFPVNDLLRRKLQTSLIVLSLTLCVASTIFLLLFGEKLGFGILSIAQGGLTAGFWAIFSRFILFIGILIFIVGAVIISFMGFLMMSQRIRDVGLMKAGGCPNDLIFGYFMTELLIVSIIGCTLGVVLGILANFASISLFNTVGFQLPERAINIWLVILVFAIFFALTLVFGAKPILDATRIEPAKAISPIHFFGLSKEPGFRIVSKSGFTTRIALRSLFRRKSATIRIVLCLSAVFVLLTVAVAGGVIAGQTTKSWIERAVGRDTLLIAQRNMTDQYRLLLSQFYSASAGVPFNYTNERYAISKSLLQKLNSTINVTNVDARLVLEAHVKEVRSYVIDPDTLATIPVGDSRTGESLIVGVEPQTAVGSWYVNGVFLGENQAWEAVVGDTLGKTLFSMPLNQSITVSEHDFKVVGVCVDPINNGNVTYVPLKTLENVTGISRPNIVMVKISQSANRAETVNQIRALVSAEDSEFEVSELNDVLDKNLSFLGVIWSAIMLLPLSSLAAASLCMIGYVILTVTEQRQEFAVLRALGAKPNTVLKIVSVQSLVVSLSSYVAGISLGTITTLLILMQEPLVTGFTIVEIAGWLTIALAAILAFSLYPAVEFARKPIVEIIA